MTISQVQTLDPTSYTVLAIVGYLVGRQCNSTAYSPLKNAMSQIGFNPGTSHIVSYHITNSTELKVKEISTNAVSISHI